MGFTYKWAIQRARTALRNPFKVRLAVATNTGRNDAFAMKSIRVKEKELEQLLQQEARDVRRAQSSNASAAVMKKEVGDLVGAMKKVGINQYMHLYPDARMYKRAVNNFRGVARNRDLGKKTAPFRKMLRSYGIAKKNIGLSAQTRSGNPRIYSRKGGRTRATAEMLQQDLADIEKVRKEMHDQSPGIYALARGDMVRIAQSRAAAAEQRAEQAARVRAAARDAREKTKQLRREERKYEADERRRQRKQETEIRQLKRRKELREARAVKPKKQGISAEEIRRRAMEGAALAGVPTEQQIAAADIAAADRVKRLTQASIAAAKRRANRRKGGGNGIPVRRIGLEE